MSSIKNFYFNKEEQNITHVLVEGPKVPHSKTKMACKVNVSTAG